MLTQEFCTHLEYALTRAFANSSDKALKGLWCDGVLPPLNESEYSQKKIYHVRKVMMRAFIGQDGQDEYEMELLFGKFALRRITKGKDIIDCIPDSEEDGWFHLDVAQRTVTVQLK